MTITLDWQPQRFVATSLVMSGLGVLACLGIVIGAALRRRRRTDAGADIGASAGAGSDTGQLEADRAVVGADLAGIQPRIVNVFRLGGVAPAWPVTVMVTLGAVAMTALMVRPALGAIVGVLVLGALRWPRLRGALRLAPGVLAVAIGLYVASGQLRHNYPPQFRWPNAFEAVRNVSWLVVLLFVAEVVVGRVVRSAPPVLTAAEPANESDGESRSSG